MSVHRVFVCKLFGAQGAAELLDGGMLGEVSSHVCATVHDLATVVTGEGVLSSVGVTFCVTGEITVT